MKTTNGKRQTTFNVENARLNEDNTNAASIKWKHQQLSHYYLINQIH